MIRIIYDCDKCGHGEKRYAIDKVVENDLDFFHDRYDGFTLCPDCGEKYIALRTHLKETYKNQMIADLKEFAMTRLF